MTLPSPVEFGAPAKFSSWRKSQEEALIEAMHSKKRFVVLGLPTGVGKTVVAAVYALFEGEGTYLVATRGQQDQVRADFEQAGFMDIRGMSNYRCLESKAGKDCSQGKCLVGETCLRRTKGCLYYDAVRTASGAPLVLTNYAFWLTDGDREGRSGQEDSGSRLSAKTLICDEAHLLGGELSRHLTTTFREGEVDLFPQDGASWTMVEVVRWARREIHLINEKLRQGGDSAEMITLNALKRRLLTATGATTGAWVMEGLEADRYGRKGWTVAPVYPEKFAGKIWRDAGKVLLVSATIRPKALDLLGIQPKDYDFLEYPSPLPMHRRPIIHLSWPGRATRLSVKSSPQVLGHWIGKIDQIIQGRLDRKGIVHSVSYLRAQMIKANSKYGRYMIIHDSRNARATIAAFRGAKAPAILVSPSVGTGYDFPYDAARWQIISKVPFPDGRGKVMRERTSQDRSYPLYVALTEVVQMAGRVMRAEKDFGETFIVDDQIQWLMWKHKGFLPGWFKSAYSRKSVPPRPKEIKG